MEKMAKRHIPDEVYNWIKDYYDNHSHCTKYFGEIYEQVDIHASVIQRFRMGPVSYLAMAADLRPIDVKIECIKFADYTYLIVPEECTTTSCSRYKTGHKAAI